MAGRQFNKFKRTRIAPTPSGFLHLGNILSFVITAGLARRHGAKILLRIDDMDQERMRPEYLSDIFDSLEFLDILWDEGPSGPDDFQRNFSQRSRMDMYQEAMQSMKKADHLFACACSRSMLSGTEVSGAYPGTCLEKNLALDQAGVCWRLHSRADTDQVMHDYTFGHVKHVFPASMQHLIVRKKDGFPAYQLCSVMDDQYFGVDLIVRGMDLLDSTLAQLHISSLLGVTGFQSSVFLHHQLLTGTDSRKLSKSAGDTSIRHLRQAGKSPADIFAMIGASLGMQSPPRSKEELFEWLLSSSL